MCSILKKPPTPFHLLRVSFCTLLWHFRFTIHQKIVRDILVFMNVSLDLFVGNYFYPINIYSALCTRDEIRTFAEEAKAIGVNYIGLCCGNAPCYFRELADVYGRTPEASKYSPDVSMSVLTEDTDKTGNKSLRKFQLYSKYGKVWISHGKSLMVNHINARIITTNNSANVCL